MTADLASSHRFVSLSHGEAETEHLGYVFASLFSKGAVVALRGELASGKTCFVRGMAQVLAAKGTVHSPTFTLINEYPKSESSALPRLVHMDLYRLGDVSEMYDLAFEELFDASVICAVEWAEKIEPILPEKRVDVLFSHIDENQRRIEIVDHQVFDAGWQKRLSQLLATKA